MKIKLTKWERQILHEAFSTVPTGTIGQVVMDMEIMEKLNLKEDEMAEVFLKDYFTGEELKQLNDLLSNIESSISSIVDLNIKLPDPESAAEETEIDLSRKELHRLCQVTFAAKGFPRQQRTVALKKRIEKYRKKLKDKSSED